MRGGFGKAGSSRSLRKTTLGTGTVATTSTVEQLKVGKRTRPARLDDPDPDVLRAWIAAGRCWWCEDPRTFDSLSGHWSQGHGFDIQTIRDLLGVPKRFAFISDEYRAKRQAHGRRLYDPAKLRVPPGTPHVLSAYGRAAQRPKAEKAWAVLRSKGLRDIERTCVICGTTFIHKSTQTCGEEVCLRVLRTDLQRGVPKPRRTNR
jgi:hypothetical protein